MCVVVFVMCCAVVVAAVAAFLVESMGFHSHTEKKTGAQNKCVCICVRVCVYFVYVLVRLTVTTFYVAECSILYAVNSVYLI